MRRLRHLVALPWARQRLLVEALVVMPLVVSALRRLGLARTGRLLRRLGAGRRTAPAAGSVDLAAMAWAARAAARRGPWFAACLSESLVLWWMLRRRGIPAEIRIGVGLPGGAVDAHAWIEVDGLPINEIPDVIQRFQPFVHADQGIVGVETLFRIQRRA